MKKTIKYRLITVTTLIIIIIFSILYWNYQPYYKKFHYIAHALGGIDNQDYTNSKEALQRSYLMGFRLMEVDFLYTSDEHLICRHKWDDKYDDGFSNENIPDYETFMSSQMYGKYTTIDIETIIRFAMKHPDVYFITDTKSGDLDNSKIVEAIVSTSKKLGYTEYNRQFIIQFYNYEDYTKLTSNYEFQNYIFTLYKMQGELRENGITNILNFCIQNNIKVVTVPEKYITNELCKTLQEQGITVFTHTIDDTKSWKSLKKIGVNGIYTNYITPLKMCYIYGRVFLIPLNLFVLLLCLIKVNKYRKKSFSQTLKSWSLEMWN